MDNSIFHDGNTIEKVGVITGALALVGGFFVAAAKAFRFLATFSEQHTLFMEHMARTEPLVERFLQLEMASTVAKQERAEMLEEIRGLRRDINDALKIMASHYGA